MYHPLFPIMPVTEAFVTGVSAGCAPAMTNSIEEFDSIAMHNIVAAVEAAINPTLFILIPHYYLLLITSPLALLIEHMGTMSLKNHR
jgi:hypothetical protein